MQLGRVYRFASREDGAVAIVVAVLLVLIFGAAAVAIDFGRAYAERRHIQGLADLSAIAAAQEIASAQARVTSTLNANPSHGVVIDSVTFGRFNGQSSVAQAQRLQSRTPGASDTNAVTVALSKTVRTPLFAVATADSELTVRAQATAVIQPLTSFSLGSRLARIDPTLLNALLNSATGSSVSLTALDWQNLANVNLSLFSFVQSLATEANLNLDGYGSLASARVTNDQLLRALSRSLGAGGNTALQSTINTVAGSTVSSTLNLFALLSIQPEMTDLAVETQLRNTNVNASTLLRAIIEVANQNRIINVPSVNLSVPGITSTSVRLLVGERLQYSGWVSVGATGATLRTSTIRLLATIRVNPTLLTGLPVGISVLTVNLPFYLEVGGATATLTSQNCRATGTTQTIASFSTSFSPTSGSSLIRAFIGSFPGADYGLRADWNAGPDWTRIVDVELRLRVLLVNIVLPLVSYEGRGTFMVGSPATTTVNFTGTEALPASRIIGTNNYVGTALRSVLSPSFLQIRTAATSLVGVVLAPVLALISSTRDALGPSIDTAVAPLVDPLINSLLGGLGISLGESQLTLIGQTCQVDLVR